MRSRAKLMVPVRLLAGCAGLVLLAGCAGLEERPVWQPGSGANREFESPNSMPRGAPTNNPIPPATGVLLRLSR